MNTFIVNPGLASSTMITYLISKWHKRTCAGRVYLKNVLTVIELTVLGYMFLARGK